MIKIIYILILKEKEVNNYQILETSTSILFKFFRRTLIMFYPDVPDEPVEFEGEGKYVVVVRGISHDKRSIRFRSQDTLSCFS